MFNPFATNGTKYQEPAHSGALPDSEGSKEPALPGTPYTPYSGNLGCLSLLTSRMRKAHAGGSLRAVQRHIDAGLRLTTRAVKEMGGRYLTFGLFLEPSK
jgi:hypothetical protein